MLLNPGMRPYVDPGFLSAAPFGGMEFLTNNWWPAFKSVAFPSSQAPAGPAPAQATVASYPSFLSAGERKAADREWLKLSAIDGPEFLCREALRHARFCPKDERVPEALSRCIHAVHFGPTNDRCDELAESAFHLLHRRYPDSAWVWDNHFWYRGRGSMSSLDEYFGSLTSYYGAIAAPWGAP